MRIEPCASQPGVWDVIDGEYLGEVRVVADEAALSCAVWFTPTIDCRSPQRFEVLGRMWLYLAKCGFQTILPAEDPC